MRSFILSFLLSITFAIAPAMAKETADATMLEAAFDGNLANFTQALQEGANVNAIKPSSGSTLTDMLFIKASATGYNLPSLEMVKAAVEAGWNPNSMLSNKETPFYIAITAENYPLAEYFLSKGADVNAILTGSVKHSALHKALQRRGTSYLPPKPEPVKWLLDNGADPNLKPSYRYQNSMTLAVVSGEDNIVKMMLDAGGNPNTTASADGMFYEEGDSILSIAKKAKLPTEGINMLKKAGAK